MLRKYFRAVGILGITEVLLRLKGLVLMPILTKSFGAVNYGIWAQVSVIVSVLTPIMVLGTDSAALRFLPGKGQQEVRRGFSTLLLYYALISIGIGVLLLAFSQPMATSFFDDVSNARFVALCGGVVFAGIMTGLCRQFYRLIGSVKAYSIANIAQSLYSTVIGLVVAISRGTIFEVVLLSLIADLLLSAILLAHIAWRYGLGRPDFAVLLKFVSFGLPLVPAAYAMWVLNLANRLFIIHYGSLQDLGVYSAVYSLGYMFISLIFNPIWLMYPPTAAELYNQGRMDELSNLFRQSTRLALGLLIPAMIGLSVLGVPILRLLSTEEFVRGATLVPVITLAYTFHMLSSYYDVSLGLVGQQLWSTINISIAAGVNLLLNYALIPTWGIAGAASATALGFGLQFCLSAWRGSRQVQLKFDWRCFAKVCLASLGMGLMLWMLPTGKFTWLLPLNAAAGAVIFAVLLLLLRALQPDELETVLSACHLRCLRRLALARVLLDW